ncbi:MAG TPA: hypothetical protein PKW21_03330 [Rhabdaerophilum sp.]|nr:hypothetical protein [Rhabdaerophilum sp.]
MPELANQIRTVYCRALLILLFPFVFAATYIDHVAPGWFSGFVTGFKFTLVFSAASSAILLAYINLFVMA